jgi:drug/metabolite transporter (DMT)-like permease
LASDSLTLRDPRSLISPSLIAALVIYGIATVMWILVLKRMPLSLAFPFYGLTFLLVPVFSHYLLGEKIGYRMLLGGQSS